MTAQPPSETPSDLMERVLDVVQPDVQLTADQLLAQLVGWLVDVGTTQRCVEERDADG